MEITNTEAVRERERELQFSKIKIANKSFCLPYANDRLEIACHFYVQK